MKVTIDETKLKSNCNYPILMVSIVVAFIVSAIVVSAGYLLLHGLYAEQIKFEDGKSPYRWVFLLLFTAVFCITCFLSERLLAGRSTPLDPPNSACRDTASKKPLAETEGGDNG